MTERLISNPILADLKKKMVFVAGPRQCGKTTLAKSLLEKMGGHYFSWDIADDRLALQKRRLPADGPLWVLDELHKYKRWRNWLKGIYDEHHASRALLVTGSAKLDVYSRGGDSLQGRYFFYRLHPFTCSEMSGRLPNDPITSFVSHDDSKPAAGKELLDLMRFGGFPEPLFSGSDRSAARWRLLYAARLVREEIRSLENLKDLDTLELLYDRLPATVGSVLSINSLREDLEVSFNTVKNWLRILDRIYAVFRIPPFGPPRIKAVKKEQKLYFWDWSRVSDIAARFENLVAFHLLRLTHWSEDIEGLRLDLRYFRNVLGHEVDFLLLKDNKPWVAVEVKLDDEELSPGIKYLLQRVKIPYAFQISLNGSKDYLAPSINGCRVRVLPAARFLARLP